MSSLSEIDSGTNYGTVAGRPLNRGYSGERPTWHHQGAAYGARLGKTRVGLVLSRSGREGYARMPELTLRRLKRTRLAQAVKGRIRRRPRLPLLSVVVPVYDAAPYLEACLESLVGQTFPNVEVLVVDDGSVDGSKQIAERFARAHSNFSVVSHPHAGMEAARNAGVRCARGEYLAFCDADDIVLPGGYDRLVVALERSGSDIAIGSVGIQRYGRFIEPKWARRSNAARRLAVQLENTPDIMANQILGTRVFRRSFWDAQSFQFETDARGSEAVVLARSILRSNSFDVLPAVVYHWRWREDGRSLRQREMRDQRLVSARIRSLLSAGALVVQECPEHVRQQFFAEILHTTVPDFVRAAVCRSDGYWETLSRELGLLMDMMPAETLGRVPVEDRMIAWLCARNQRDATEDFLEYAWDNKFGYPFRSEGADTFISLPFIDAVPGADDALLRLAASDRRFRTRLMGLRWSGPGRLSLEGAAFIEYTDDGMGASTIELVLKEQHTGAEIVIPTRPAAESIVNEWAERAHEDHRGGAFHADIDIQSLWTRIGSDTPLQFDVNIRLRLGHYERVGPFQTRHLNGSASLLEQELTADGLRGEPLWAAFRGLSLQIDRATEGFPPPEGPPVVVDDLTGGEGTIEVHGRSRVGIEVALIGPRTQSHWVKAEVGEDGKFVARVSTGVDEWGMGPACLPLDNYAAMMRTSEDAELETLPASRHLWRSLPRHISAGLLDLFPNVSPEEGILSVRIAPREAPTSRPPYPKRQLRDGFYPTATTKPLLDAVLFETFAGKAAGDNPGALCEELAARDAGLDLAFSVVDRSIAVPEGARAVVRWSPEWYELMARARYLVINAALPYFFRKRPDQVYLQTWHGSPLKRIAHDRPNLDFDNWHHRRQLRSATAGWDYLISQSDFCTQALRSAFRYDGEVLEVGYPRNDVLSSDEAVDIRRKVREHFNLSATDRVILYAPTWRDNSRVGQVFNKVLYLETRRLVEKVPNAVVLVRGHYNSIGAAETRDPNHRVIDVTRYPEITHLYLAADALVTDYSSVFFDFALTDKPMVFLVPDLAEYREENRGFYLDFHETVPGPVCVNTDQVVAALNGPDEHSDVREAFRQRFTPLDDGRASKRVIDAVFVDDRPVA